MGVHPKTIKNDYFKGQNDGNTVILLGVAPCSYASPAVSQQIRTPSPGTPCGKRKIWDVFACPAMSGQRSKLGCVYHVSSCIKCPCEWWNSEDQHPIPLIPSVKLFTICKGFGRIKASKASACSASARPASKPCRKWAASEFLRRCSNWTWLASVEAPASVFLGIDRLQMGLSCLQS